MALDTIKITCTDNNKEAKADVISRTDKKLVVVLRDTDIKLTLTRSDVRRHYIGVYGTLEFIAK